MARGILDTLGLAGALVFAIPIGLFGAEHLFRGDLLSGVAYVAIAALLVLIEQHLVTPTDIPAVVAAKTIGAVAETDDASDTNEPP